MKLLKRILLSLLALILIALAVVVFGLAPGFFHKTVNRVDGTHALEISTAAQNLHESLFVVDLHNDALLWDFDLNEQQAVAHSDIPRLLAGGARIQVFSVVTQTMMEPGESNTGDSPIMGIQAFAQLQRPSTWFSSLARAEYQADKLERFESRSNGGISIIRNRKDMERIFQDDSKLGAILALEGVHALNGDLDNAKLLFESGYRIFGLTHFFDNAFAGSSQGVQKTGLTTLGEELVHFANKKGIVLDLAHASEATMLDVLSQSSQPVIISHTGVRGVCDNSRNLSDAVLNALARNGGVVGIGFWRRAVCDVSPLAISRSVRYAADLMGVRHVSLGSDFEGGVTVPFDATGFSQLTQALIDEGFDEREIRMIMGENAVRVLRQVLPTE